MIFSLLSVLAEDNYENRSSVFNFFDTYDSLDLAERFPVSFQFVPIELIGNLKNIEELALV